MRKRKHKKTIAKLGLLFTIILFLLASISMSYAHWTDTITIQGTVTTGTWETPCLCIRKVLDGSYTDPYTGDDLTIPNYDLNLIHQSDNNDPGFPTKFKLRFEVNNTCDEDLTDVVVTDRIGNVVAPRSIITKTHGSVTFEPYGFEREGFGHDDMTWSINTLLSGEIAVLEIWIETLPNGNEFYEPTSEDQPIPINDGGATVTATNSDGDTISATTESITLDIDPYGIPENQEPNDYLAIIAAPQLPYATPWVCNG